MSSKAAILNSLQTSVMIIRSIHATGDIYEHIWTARHCQPFSSTALGFSVTTVNCHRAVPAHHNQNGLQFGLQNNARWSMLQCAKFTCPVDIFNSVYM